MTCYDGCIVTTQKQTLGLYAVLACMIGAFAGGPLLAQDEGINWLGDYREAVRQAKQSNKPIFLEFRCEA
jgi:hypothetical protein